MQPNLVTVETNEIIVTLSTIGLQGPQGATGPGGTDTRIVEVGEITSAGLTGVEVAVADMGAADDYVVMLNYVENPHGNGALFSEREIDKFTIKHAGTHFVAVGYTVLRKVAI